ncbi:FAD-dependent monooxygenase [Streptomyces sp. NBC_01795]|uniref:FAD-dependent monooxygenase n=1 Tax=Streptomyces sp. NBC_01795 TaxID=2975943 RepID=UPI002DD7E3DF|nr:FAD-dependent monooxygenase [Streptomyces sp. NBC_01795]WSA95895.1 FAD-dependent monooxygenase [Streptomyces sp. NBC_01795]
MNNLVAIAGAGPAGLMLACELRTAGVPTVVFDPLPEPRRAAPGVAINPAVVELLDQRGVMDALRADGMEFRQAFFAHLALDPTKLPEERAYNFAVPQQQVERRLEEHALKLGADIRRGYRITDLEQDEEGVTLTVADPEGARHTERCGYLAGCDGAGSTVRELVDVGFPGQDSPFYGIVADLDMTEELFPHLGARQYDEGLFTVTPTGPATLRVMTGELGRTPADPDAEPTPEELRERARHITGADLALESPHWLARWFHITRLADRYRTGRVFLVGEAAHVHFPLGGQALSTTIEDAVDLGWKLAAAVHGWAPEGLLDTYHAERHPVGARACRTTLAQTALMHPMDRIAPVRELLAELIGFDDVNAHLVRLAGALDVTYPLGGDGAQAHPLTGRRLGDVVLETPEGEHGLAELLRPGRGVVVDLSGGLLGPRGTEGWQGRVDVVMAEPSAGIGATGLLLRPDGRVAWATDDSDDKGLRAALERWFGQPGGGEGRV